jgi:hypothetical protein
VQGLHLENSRSIGTFASTKKVQSSCRGESTGVVLKWSDGSRWQPESTMLSSPKAKIRPHRPGHRQKQRPVFVFFGDRAGPSLPVPLSEIFGEKEVDCHVCDLNSVFSGWQASLRRRLSSQNGERRGATKPTCRAPSPDVLFHCERAESHPKALNAPLGKIIHL